MDCKEYKIWFDNASENEIISEDADYKQHLTSCKNCEFKFERLIDAYLIMQSQRQLSLSNEQSNGIINKLIEISSQTTGINSKTIYLISRIAAILVIAFGLIAGTIIGGTISTQDQKLQSPWNSEFSILSDNTDFDSYLFE